MHLAGCHTDNAKLVNWVIVSLIRQPIDEFNQLYFFSVEV